MPQIQLPIIYLLFFASGFAGLVFEIVFCRQLLRLLGNSSSANACVFAAFMSGAALGALLFHKLTSSSNTNFEPRTLLKIYGRLEGILASSAFLLCAFLSAPAAVLLPRLLAQFLDNPWLCELSRFAIAFLLLCIPCTAMGAAFMSLNSALKHVKEQFAGLYAANTAGAALATAVTAFYLLENFGIQRSGGLAALIYLAIFLLVEFHVSNFRLPAIQNETLADSRKQSKTAPFGLSSKLAVGVFFSGFLSFLLEIVWTRIFALIFGSSIYSLSVVLLMVLSAVSAASFFCRRLKVEPKNVFFCTAAAFLASGISILLCCYFNQPVFHLLFE
ncbi:MAG: hypothetical protein K2X27_13600, partial [Candidatus Obscuribacterales bacterium]|nr:hypothetical protein [Candidatus Obscuribacterales bacterium]